jgi:preprotein translocase subunit SecG
MVVLSILCAYVVPTSSAKGTDIIEQKAQESAQTNPYNLPAGNTAPEGDLALPTEPAEPAN